MQWFGQIPPPSLARHLDKWLKPRLWSDCGWTSPWLWGLVRTRGSLVYRVVLNRTTRTSQCTCSARTQPCVHAAALLIGWQQNQWEVVTNAPLAPWLPEQISPPKHSTPPPQRTPSPGWVTPAHITEMEKGYQLLGQWMQEQSRLGWKHLLASDMAAVEDITTRLVDLRLPGPARMVRQLALGAESGNQTAFLRQILSRLILAQRAFVHREHLSEEQWHSLLIFSGITIRKDTLKKRPAVTDRWLALSVVEEEAESDLRSRKIWLVGTRTTTFALVLDFAWKRAPFPQGLAIGQVWEGGLYFYPGSDQTRAILGEGSIQSNTDDTVPGLGGWAEAHDVCTRAMARDPLRLEVPILIQALEAGRQDGQPVLMDARKRCLPLSISDRGFEQLLSSQAPQGLHLFGLLRAGVFLPLARIDRGRPVAL
ncbi:MAG: hypothetical protein H6568_14435 [Lewinellaceae bacterium]|nr:hypothetical protein [Lewinellaceae bacterium]